ncbi:MAG: ComEC/Rec2 family competence protein [Truepera sp.]|nr:ComEC/Rec2 family competence protein [Truepera sp.]
MRSPGGGRSRPGTFVPWSLPLAAGTVLGALGAAVAGAGPTLIGSVLLAVGGALLWWRLGWRWPHVASGGAAAMIAFAPVLLLSFALGAARMQAWRSGPSEQARAAVSAEWSGAEREWRGRSDGDYLYATQPARAKLALVMPAGAAAPVGDVVVTGTAEPAPGKRNPGGFDYAGHLARRGAAGQLFARSVVLVRPATRVSDLLARGVTAGLPAEAGALMLAMTLGRRDDLAALRESFGAAGMSHLLALSGLHVGVLLLALGGALRRLPRGRVPLVAGGALAFVMLVGPSPSVVRATTMALAVLLTSALGSGRAGVWAALGLAALIGTLMAPQMVLDLGFQLSYLAVVGMLLFVPPWTARLGSLVSPLPAGVTGLRRVVLAVRTAAVLGALASAAAQLPTLSLVAGTFLAVPLASPLVNVAAVPLAGLLVPFGFAAGLAGLVAEPLAWLLNQVVGPLAGCLIWLARVGARLPSLPWGEVAGVGHVAWAGLTAALAAWARGRLRLAQVLAVALVLGGVTSAVPAPTPPPDIWFLDVGQGDAALVRLGPGTAVLVDGGGSPFSDFDVGKRIVVPALRALGVRQLSAVIATHADADHVEGLVPVLENFRVGLLVTGPPQPGNLLDERLRSVAAQRGVRVHEARRGERLSLGGAVLELLNPPADTSGLSPNDASVAFVLRLAGVPRALFLGDLGVGVEPDLAVPPLDVLMVGHHGSRHSTSEGLLKAASPGLAVISVGRNGYGHPTAEVLERLAAHGVEVMTTREHGAIRVDLSGEPSWTPSVVPAAPP